MSGPMATKIDAIRYKLRTRSRLAPWAVLALNGAGWATAGALLGALRLLRRRGRAAGPRRILLIRADRVGDMILTTPVLAAFRRRYPEAHIACLASTLSAPLLGGNPDVNEVAAWDPPWFDRRTWSGAKSYVRLVPWLRTFDMAVDFRGNALNALLLMAVPGIPERVGYEAGLGTFLLTRRAPFRPGQHETAYFVDLARHLGAYVEEPPRACLALSAEEEAFGRAFLEKQGFPPGAVRIVLHPGAGDKRLFKRWPAENYVELARLILQRHDAVFVVSGGPAEVGLASSIREGIGPRAVLAAGVIPDLRRLAAVIRECRLCIGSSTGVIHVASAVGTAVVVLSGPEDHARWHPLGPHAVVRHDVPCRPCRETVCARAGECMRLIAPAEVLEAAEPFLGAGRADRPS